VTRIVVFDGLCNLCTGSVRFILAHEKSAALRFAPLQSAAGARLMREHGLDPRDAKTFVLVEGGRAYVKSDAAIRLAAYLRGAGKLLALLVLVPRPLRNWFYDIVARNRYRWFGRRDACMAPGPELAKRFIEE
jgi:predicted DCC family thiol-disulfide oxidoreductase YuxK